MYVDIIISNVFNLNKHFFFFFFFSAATWRRWLNDNKVWTGQRFPIPILKDCYTQGLLYPEWPHMQCAGLALRRSHVRGWLSAVSLVICSPARIAVCNTWSSGVLLCVGWGCDQSIGSTVSDAIVRSWLWLTATRAPHWTTSVKLLQVVDHWTHILW